MLKNYLKIALRNLRKNKAYSFITIFGLAMGLACCMLIAVYVFDELSYDKNNPLAGQIYRVELHTLGNGSVETYPNVDIAVGKGIKDANPEVITFTRLLQQRATYVKYEEKQFKETKLAAVDSNFLQVFNIRLIEGDAAKCLTEPNSIVVSKDFAGRYFGNADPIGKTVQIGISTLKVTGVINKVPDNTHFHFDAFMSMSFGPNIHQTWSNIGFYTYLVLNKHADPKKLEARFPDLVAKNVVPEIARDMGVSMAEAQKSVNTFRFTLQPLTNIHLYSHTKYELDPNGDIQYVYVFGALAIFILLLACVNFTNLSTAGSAKRAREVGIRKVLGSGKKQLVIQFLAESVLLAFFSIIIAFLLAYLLMPYFDRISGKQSSFHLLLTAKYLIPILLLGLGVGMLAGLYPAFFISSFNTIATLKGSAAASTSHKSPLRSALVVFQFSVSTGLIIATLIVYNQLHFMQDKKLGYDKEQVVFLQDTYLLGNRDVQTAFKQSLLKDSRIVNVSISSNIPGNPDMDGTQIYAKDKIADETHAEIHSNIFYVDYDYIPTLGIRMAAGRNFSRDFSTDSFGVIINQAAVRDLGWGHTNPIGKSIVRSGQQEFKVVGVTEDFHYASVKQKIAPLMLRLGGTYRSGLIIKIKTRDVYNLLADIKKQWAVFNPGAPFAYFFLDEKFASLYASEQKTGQIFTAFAVIAILIACLGLFGLATHITQQRTKEIGVRKIFGASVQNILVLVSKEFLALVALACIIAIPLAWWAMHAWLQDFAYRMPVSPWVFAIAAFSAITIALLTVSYQAIKAAIANPVKSLRTE
jgi:putative ABC transport system permease protein